ncbi:protein TolQ [Halotalea alkalilenta]|uniref:protein TolQ n=1 Tax=Halotalea alkalilenta TaxID=376489 RepID=UPI00047F12E6|nr:protein TolQ [Halotalea alkalilenta]
MDVEDSMSIVALVTNASLVVKLVMLVLLVFSLVSWVLIFQRAISMRRAERDFAGFEARFWSGIDLNDLNREQPEATEGAAHVFQAGFKAFNRLRARLRGSEDQPPPTPKQAASMLLEVERAMRVALSREEARLTHHLPILASISSSSPYIGLFGTVWGIMGSFQTLSDAEQATLATVAPWIAEALIATAMGLFAAIPAVIAYNRFTSASERLIAAYRDFAEEFHTILHRSVVARSAASAKV